MTKKLTSLQGFEVPPIRLEPLPGSKKWLTEVSLLKEKVKLDKALYVRIVSIILPYKPVYIRFGAIE